LAGACGHVQRMFSLLRQRPPLHCTFVTVCVLMALLLRCVKVRVMLPGSRTMLGDAAAEAELFATEEFVTVSSSSSRTGKPLGRCLTELIHRFGRLAGCQAPPPRPARRPPGHAQGQHQGTSCLTAVLCFIMLYLTVTLHTGRSGQGGRCGQCAAAAARRHPPAQAAVLRRGRAEGQAQHTGCS
jgi:hypothetical protein